MKNFLQKDSLRALTLAVGLLVLPSVAQADWVRYDGKNADLNSQVLYGDKIIFDSSTTAVGTLVDLGEQVDFSKFSLNVSNDTTVGFEMTQVTTDLATGYAHVGFEDHTDMDFNDVNITVADEENKLVQNPEPATIVLFGSGLLGLGAWRLRKKQA